jgi:hypothetical protein
VPTAASSVQTPVYHTAQPTWGVEARLGNLRVQADPSDATRASRSLPLCGIALWSRVGKRVQFSVSTLRPILKSEQGEILWELLIQHEAGSRWGCMAAPQTFAFALAATL